MRELFQIGRNANGFFVFPYTNPPASLTPSGDEVGLVQACRLCNSLNEAVTAHVSNLARKKPLRLLRAIVQRYTYRGILRFLGDLMWQEAWDTRSESTAGILRHNSLNVGRLIRDWL